MKLTIATIEEFKNIIYPEYLNLFPELERKSYHDIKKSIINEITTIFKIMVEKEMVGFMIINQLEDVSCIQLDYLGILKQYKKNGYGSETIKLLTTECQNMSIFIEIEKEKLGTSEEENKIRERRAKFYEKLGFQKMNFDMILNTVIFSTYLLDNSDRKSTDEEIARSILITYEKIIGKEKVLKNIRIEKTK